MTTDYIRDRDFARAQRIYDNMSPPEGDCTCPHCGDEHADETEEDRCGQISDGECWCDECGKGLALERAKADQWMCEACEKEWANAT